MAALSVTTYDKCETWKRYSRTRTHALHVGNRTLFVNAYYLAELSQFYEKLFFDDFKEVTYRKYF